MVFITLPILKLSLLGIRQLARPVSNFIRMEAKQSKIFRNYVCMPAAQCYHWCEVTLKTLLLNMGRPVKVEPLNESTAIDLGAEILGELIVFVVAAAALMYETKRQVMKRNLEAQSVNIHHMDMLEALKILEYRQVRQKAYLQEMTRVLTELGKPINLHETKSKESKHKSE